MQFNLINFLDCDSSVPRKCQQFASDAVIVAIEDRRKVITKRTSIKTAGHQTNAADCIRIHG